MASRVMARGKTAAIFSLRQRIPPVISGDDGCRDGQRIGLVEHGVSHGDRQIADRRGVVLSPRSSMVAAQPSRTSTL